MHNTAITFQLTLLVLHGEIKVDVARAQRKNERDFSIHSVAIQATQIAVSSSEGARGKTLRSVE